MSRYFWQGFFGALVVLALLVMGRWLRTSSVLDGYDCGYAQSRYDWKGGEDDRRAAVKACKGLEDLVDIAPSAEEVQ